MTFKINISAKSGKTYKLESEAEALIDKALHDKVQGKELLPDLEGYEFEITGASDNAGFTAMKNVEGVGLKKVLLGYGKAMHRRPRREGKKKVSNPRPKGLRMRKTVRGRVISEDIIQINLKVLKEGAKKLEEVFPEQNKKEEIKTEKETPVIEQSQDTETKGDLGENSAQEGGALSETQKENAESQSDSENKELINKENPESSGEATPEEQKNN